MTRVLIVILIIIVIGYLWYQMQERRNAAARSREEPRLSTRAEAPPRPLPPAASAAPPAREPSVDAGDARGDGGVVGRFQSAADAAAALELEQQKDQMEDLTADLAEARREADLAAARLAEQADEALAEVRAAALEDEVDVIHDDAAAVSENGAEIIEVETVLIRDRDEGARHDIVAEAIAAADAGSVPPGAIRGDGGLICPPAYPIKGNARSMKYHEPANPTYSATIPELCFSTVEAAEAAGYSVARH